MTAGARFSLGTFAFDGEAAPYLVIDERAHDLRPVLGDDTTLRGLIDDWDAKLPELQRLADEGVPGSEPLPLSELRPLPRSSHSARSSRRRPTTASTSST